MKKIKLFTIILSATILSGALAGCSCFGSSCYGGSNGGSSTATRLSTSVTENETEITYGDGVTTYENDDVDTEENTYDSVFTETMTIGSDTLGYVDIPADCYSFYDPDASPNALQYCYKHQYNIVTLDIIERNGVSTQEFAELYASVAKEDPEADPEQFFAGTVKFYGIGAYEISRYYPAENQYFVVYLFDSPYDDYIHYFAVEALADEYDFATLVQDSYRLRNE